MTEQPEPRMIKRYANRKLYDMSESTYITQDEIASLVEQGVNVRVIDNQTKEDITSATLTHILFEKEKQHRRTLPLSTLRGLFQTGGDFIQRHITQPVTSLRDEAETTVRKVLGGNPAEAGEEAPLDEAEPPPNPDPAARSAGSRSRPSGEGFREWLIDTQRAFESWQRSFEERWNLLTNTLGHFDANAKRITELEQRVAELEARLAAKEKGADE